MNVDPLAEKYSSWSPYNYVFNNPLNFIDPDGKDGVRVIDKENKQITIKANYYVQTDKRLGQSGKSTDGYTSKEVKMMEKNVNQWFANQNMTINEGEYEGYTLCFELTFIEGGTGSNSVTLASNDEIGNSFLKGNSKTDPQIFTEIEDGNDLITIGGVTHGNKHILINTDKDKNINRIHEMGHTFGLKDNIKTGKKGGIMNYPPGNKLSQEEINELGYSNFLPLVNLNSENE